MPASQQVTDPASVQQTVSLSERLRDFALSVDQNDNAVMVNLVGGARWHGFVTGFVVEDRVIGGVSQRQQFLRLDNFHNVEVAKIESVEYKGRLI